MKEKDKPPAAPETPGVSLQSIPLSAHERAVITALREVAFGEIEVTVHNARIVQITRSQKFRFNDR